MRCRNCTTTDEGRQWTCCKCGASYARAFTQTCLKCKHIYYNARPTRFEREEVV